MNSITIPSKAEVAVSIERTVENLDRLGITHNVAPVQEIDWANYIEDAQEMLNLWIGGWNGGARVSSWNPLSKAAQTPIPLRKAHPLSRNSLHCCFVNIFGVGTPGFIFNCHPLLDIKTSCALFVKKKLAF